MLSFASCDHHDAPKTLNPKPKWLKRASATNPGDVSSLHSKDRVKINGRHDTLR